VRPLKNLGLYYQYSEVFQPQGGGALRLDGSALAPITASSEEYGVRLSFLDEKLNFEVVKYTMISNGIAIRLPAPNTSFFANGGQTTSDGYEYTLTYNDPRLTLQAGLVDVFVRDTTPGILGAQQGGQPRYRGQLHARYKWPKLGGNGGLSIGASAIHAAERPLSATTTSQMIPAYQFYNLNANYGIGKGLNLALAVGNVFDKKTIVGNSGILWRPLDPRTMKLTLTKTW
jgi:catecholate siderophore receptor